MKRLRSVTLYDFQVFQDTYSLTKKLFMIGSIPWLWHTIPYIIMSTSFDKKKIQLAINDHVCVNCSHKYFSGTIFLCGLVLRLFEHPDDINFTAVVIMGGAWYWQKFQNSVAMLKP